MSCKCFSKIGILPGWFLLKTDLDNEIVAQLPVEFIFINVNWSTVGLAVVHLL